MNYQLNLEVTATNGTSNWTVTVNKTPDTKEYVVIAAQEQGQAPEDIPPPISIDEAMAPSPGEFDSFFSETDAILAQAPGGDVTSALPPVTENVPIESATPAPETAIVPVTAPASPPTSGASSAGLAAFASLAVWAAVLV